MNEEVQHAPDADSAVDSPAEEGVKVAVAPAPLPSLGELMVAARERWNLSAADVARQLRLGLRQVEALEESRFEVLPGNTFVRGFIRNYAKVVQVDPVTFLEAYERSHPQIRAAEIVTQTEQIEFSTKPIPKWVWLVAGTVAVGLLAPVLIYLALHDDNVPVKAKPLAAMPKAETTLSGDVVTPLALPPPQVISLGAAPLPSPDVKPVDVLIPPVPLPTEAKSVAAKPVISMKFSGDAWVEIRDKSGKKIFSDLSRTGSEQTVQGEPPLSLVVGDAARVRITYNGKPVDLSPHVKKTVARLTLE